MPPYYDIYALSKVRNKQNIENFLACFAYRNQIENCENQEIRTFSIKDPEKEVLIPVLTLTEVIHFGVENQDHCFAFYIGDHLKRGINHIILKFTADGKIIFGISIEEKRIEPNGLWTDNYDHAYKIEKQLTAFTQASKTSIQFEYPPADNEEEFDKDILLWKNIRAAINMKNIEVLLKDKV